ncbi:DUF998 domain-containing protein [Actinoplanes sp. NPDC049802]|uniref:DUF998 domain-containing protein n=1 Tax=Actinoplanes sp. NPDC049802 TaxID=3154742 RepID=UPI0033D18876
MTAVVTTSGPIAHIRTGTRALLIAGAWAGPFFVVSSLLQMLARDGFDLRRHALSQLAVGHLGWLQVATFTLTGLGIVALAVGLWRTLATGAGRRTVPLFTGVFGAGLVLAGLFPPDAENGFPAGTPGGPVAAMSWHAVVHATAAVLAFTALAVACAAHTIRSARRRAVAAAVLSGIVTVVLLLPPAPAYTGIQLAVTGLISFAWTTALALSALAARTAR